MLWRGAEWCDERCWDRERRVGLWVVDVAGVAGENIWVSDRAVVSCVFEMSVVF